MKKLVFLLCLLIVGKVYSQCLAPTGISVTGITSSSAYVTFNAASGATSYSWNVFTTYPTHIEANPGGNTTSRSFNFTGLQPSKTYRFQVVSICGSSVSAPDSVVFSTPANEISYTPMTAAGYQFKYLKADSGLTVPNADTNLLRGTTRPGSLVYKNGAGFYGWNGSTWSSLSGGGGGGVVDTPTLQAVLNKNHDLSNGNNFQGTSAGITNTGINVIGLGQNAAISNQGSTVIALGPAAGTSNFGNNVNAIGLMSAQQNFGSDINALGQNAAFENYGDSVNAFGTNAGSNNTFSNINLFGTNASATANNQTSLAGRNYQARIDYNRLSSNRTYNLPDSSGTIALLSNITGGGGGTVTSVGLTMPSAFSVTNSPVTTSGTIAVTGSGSVSQYVRGDGTLANFPNSTGGGSSVNYYLNGSVSQGTFGGDTYYQMSKTPILGAGTNFTRTNGAGNGYVASFITDSNDPSFLNIPGGNWNLEFYFNASASGGTPQFYGEIYKVSSTNVFTLVASGSSNPEGITNGTTVDQYFTSISVPQTTLLVTDRLAIRIYVVTSGRSITLHTENGNLCEVLTTFTTGLTALNGLTAQVQNFATGTSGSDFNIVSSTDTHTFNLPNAGASSRGVISTGTQTIAGAKTFTSPLTITTISGGLLIPRLSTSERNAIGTPSSQLLISNTDKKTLDQYNGTNWYSIAGDFNKDLLGLQALGSPVKSSPIGSTFMPGTGAGLTPSRSFFSAIVVDKEITITGAMWYQSTQGVYIGTGANYNGIALYSQNNGTLTLIDSTARDTTIWKAPTASWNQKAFAGGTRTLQPGVYYLMALSNTLGGTYTTAPVIGIWQGINATGVMSTNSSRLYGGIVNTVTVPPSTQAMSAWNNFSFYYSLYLY